MDIDPKITALQERRLQLIGNICTQWSYLEYILLRAMVELLDLAEMEIGKIVFGGLDIRPRIAMAVELAKHLKAPKRLIVALIATRTAIDGGLLKRRNRAIHGVQFIYIDGELRVEVHRGRDRARRTLSEWELWQIGADISEVSAALNHVINDVFWGSPAPPYALLDKPVRRPRKQKARAQDQTPKPPAPRRKASPKKSQSE